MDTENQLRVEVTKALAAFAGAWPSKWQQNTLTLAVWLDTLYDVEPDEVRAAVRRCVAELDWPPSIAEFRSMIPRLCRCGKCAACHSKAVARARRAIDRGSIGADFDTPVHIGKIVTPNAPRLNQ